MYNYFDSVVFCYGKHPVRPANRRNQILAFWPNTRVMSAYLLFNDDFVGFCPGGGEIFKNITSYYNFF